jgi:hypothetical protein
MPNDSAFPAHTDDQPIFTADWFDATAKPVWSQFIPDLPAGRVLEVGSYEGASACYLIARRSKSTAWTHGKGPPISLAGMWT